MRTWWQGISETASSPVRTARGRVLRLRARVAAALLACALAAPAAAQDEIPAAQREFVRRSLSLDRGTQDTFAASFNAAKLPLLARAVANREREGIASDSELYAALTRWHFWMGKRWDDRNRGLWSTDPVWLPVTGDMPGGTLATLAALELVQLGALSEMALQRGLVFDALVWNDDRARLGRRMLDQLHDPLMGAYADLDSLGQRISKEARLSSLLPIGLGAPALRDRARALGREVWAGDESTRSAGASLHAIERAEQLYGWTSDSGIHLLDPEWTAALSLVAVERLEDPALRRLVTDALTTSGLSVRDSVDLHLGDWELALDPRALDPPALHGSRVALRFLRDACVVPAEEVDPLLVGLQDPATADLDSLVEELTDRLVTWRSRDLEEEHLRLRGRAEGLTREGSAFQWRESDWEMWSRRALDAIAEDIVASHLRPEETAPYAAVCMPQLLGRGDRAELRLEPPLEDEAPIGAAWTDGLRVIPVEVLDVQREGDHSRVSLSGAPDELGLWWAVVRVGGRRPRVAPTLAVVEPVALSVHAFALDDGPPRYRLEVRSQVAFATTGRVEISPPLSWGIEPSSRLDFALDAGATQSWVCTFRPDDEASPAIYPVEWTLFDEKHLVDQVRSDVAVHYRWLRLEGLKAEGHDALARDLGPDRAVDLARRYDGVEGPEHWSRLPGTRLARDGWIELATVDDPEGAHYALTAFTTGSREAFLHVESDAPVLVRVNGEEVTRVERGGGTRDADLRLVPGTNFVLVKLLGGAGHGGRFRLELRDVVGEPIRGVDNALENLIDGYAYVSGGGAPLAKTPAAVQRDQMRLVTITYRNPAATRVFVVGSFNGWSPTATPMTQQPDGRWEARIRLRPGRFEYKFAVDGSRWIADPVNPINVLDGFGTRNSVLVIE